MHHNIQYRSSKPSLTRPDDFFDFWRRTRDALALIDPACIAQQEASRYDNIAFSRLRFRSLGNAEITGYLMQWTDATPRPVIVYTHGYNSQTHFSWPWAKQGAHVLGFDTRGFGRSRHAVAAIADQGYILTGVENPETSILRGAVCDYSQAVSVAKALLGQRLSKILCYGRSFAGAMAIMSEAITPQADVLAVGVPSLAWAEGRRRLAIKGSSGELNGYLRSHPNKEEKIMHSLRYFDTMNLASLIQCPTLIGVGQQDDYVPAATVYAIINHLQCRYEVHEYPHTHSGLALEERDWKQFFDSGLALVQSGVPDEFGLTLSTDHV